MSTELVFSASWLNKQQEQKLVGFESG